MRDADNLERVCELGPDFIGFIFFRASLRYVGEHPDKRLFSIPGDSVSRVGVFVNEPLLSLRRMIGSDWFDVVQLHGTETPEYCKSLVNEGVHVIKTIGPDQLLSEGKMEAYNGVVHYFLIDTAGEGQGGSGEKFDWSLLENYTLPVPFLLSGGIGPGDGPSIRAINHLSLRGVDLNSRFEERPGLKNIDLLQGFINELRK